MRYDDGCVLHIEAEAKWPQILFEILQMHWMKIVVFWFKFYCKLFQRFNLRLASIGPENDLVSSR